MKQNSTKQIALMEDRILTKQNSTKQMALTKNTISTRQIALNENTVSTKQMALMEERISSWNMNGSVPILTFTGRGEYLSQILCNRPPSAEALGGNKEHS